VRVEAAPTVDVGNLQEAIMVLEEILSNARAELQIALDSNDDRIIGSAVGKIEEIEERIAEFRKEIARAIMVNAMRNEG
jgi:ABC-type Fe3+-citrate transport system substrate-binding protein